MYRFVSFRSMTPKSRRVLSVPALSGGLCCSDLPYRIDDSQSPDLLNVCLRQGVLSKRPGRRLCWQGEGPVYRVAEQPFGGLTVFHAGTRLLGFDPQNESVRVLGEGLAPKAGVFFPLGGLLYYLDGTRLWQLSEQLEWGEVTPYVPVLLTGASPSLSESTPFESWNLLGRGFTVLYSGNASATLYRLPYAGLADDPVEVKVGGNTLTEGEHFTADRAAGTLTFHGDHVPPTGISNVEVTAFLPPDRVEEDRGRILGCTLAAAFGGQSSQSGGGTRIFLSGNPAYPCHYFRSALLNPAYWPDLDYDLLDADGDPISAMGCQYGELIFFKTRSIYAMSFVSRQEGTPLFPVRQIHSALGCDMPGSLRLIDNRLVFAHSEEGVFLLDGTDRQSELNAKPLSANIAPLLREHGKEALQGCTSADYGRSYWLCVGQEVFCWDYGHAPYVSLSDWEQAQRRLAWFRFSPIESVGFFSRGGRLYHAFGHCLAVFTPDLFDDLGSPIRAYAVSKYFDLGSPHIPKCVPRVHFMLQSPNGGSARVSFLDQRGRTASNAGTARTGSFSWDRFNWDTFCFEPRFCARPFSLTAGLRGVHYFAVRFDSDDPGRDLGLSHFTVEFTS